MLEIICLIVGFIFLIAGTSILIMGTSDIARRGKLSSLSIDIIIVAFATSIPELLVSFKAMISGYSNIVIYNLIGSNIINILFILGLVCIIRPIKLNNNTIKKELPLSIMLAVLFIVLTLDDLFVKGANNILTRSDALVLILFFLIYIYYMITIIKERREIRIIKRPIYSIPQAIFFTIIGFMMILIGSIFAVDMAHKITLFGIDEKMLTLLIIAFATSLPELIVCLTALKNNEQDLIIGNILGSNIFNICIVLALPIIIMGNLNMNCVSIIDILNFLIAAIILLVFAPIKKHIGKIEGIIMFSIFLIYYVYIILEGVL